MSNSSFLSTSSSVSELVASLGREERLVASELPVWCFKKVIDIVEGIELRLSNMAGGYPFEFAGVNWASSEQLYLCGEFTDEAIQQELLSVTSGYAAKRFIKAKYKAQVREDFPTFRLQWMLFVVWQCRFPNQVTLHPRRSDISRGNYSRHWRHSSDLGM